MSGFRVGQWVDSGRHWYAWLGNTRVVDEDDYRRLRSQTVWQAIAAIIGFAVAWDLGAKYYLVGGKEWVEP